MKLASSACLLLWVVSVGLTGCEPEAVVKTLPSPRPSLLCLKAVGASEPIVGWPKPTEISLPVGEFDSTVAKVWEPLVHTAASTVGLVFVSGVDGGFIEPADNIYTATAGQFAWKGVRSIFVRYRSPGVLAPSLEDVQSAAGVLKREGVGQLAIVGWSFGGAVITNAATEIPEIVSVIGFAPQSRDTVPIRPDQSILLFHSEDDVNVPISASEDILADTPLQSKREFHRLTGYDHQLDGAGTELKPWVTHWLERELSLDPACRH